MRNNNADHYFLQGGGEMGEIIRGKDWSKTSIGDPSAWPPSLRTTVGILLNSKFPMFLWWSDELICFYNDAYRPSLGKDGKHPSILGMAGKDAWPEIWEIIKPLIDSVMIQGESIWFEDRLIPIYRNGNIEDVYWTFSYSPVHNEEGRVSGVLVNCVETTEKVKTLRKIEESDQRFRSTMKQAPVGITILRGTEYLVEMANDAYLQLVDKKETEFVGNPLFTSLPEVEEAVHSLLDSVLNTGVPYHGNEVPIPLKRYGKQDVFYFDFLYHPLREHDGTVSGVIVAVTEVTEKVETRKAIEERKRLYETVTQNTPDLVYVFDLNYHFTYANEALLKMWGRSWDDSVGKSLLQVGYEPWHAEMHEREIDQVIATKKPVRGEVSFPHATLGKRIYDYIFVPVIDQHGQVEAISGITRDITQQVEAHKQIEESEMRFRSMVEQAPVAICVLRGENYLVEVANEKQLKLWGKTKDQVLNLPIFTAIPETRGQGFEELLGGVFTTGKAFIANEMPAILTRNGSKETIYLNLTYEPLYNSENKILGIISIVSDVTEQVIARKKIEESDEKLRSLIENAPFPLGVFAGKEMRIELANESIIKAWGKGNDVKGKLYKELIPEVESQQVFEQLDTVFNTGIPFHAHNKYLKLVIDGVEQDYYYNYSFTPVFDSLGKVYGVMNTASDVTELNLAKKRIEESEQDLRSMALRSPIGICILDAATLVCEIVNDSFIEIAGKPREAIAGKYYWDSFAEAKPYYETALHKVITEGTLFFANEIELKIIRHGKEEKMYVTFVYAPLNNEEGKVKKVAIWVLDNTQQVMARRKIEEDAEKLNIVIDASELGTWELNLKSNEPTYSKRYLEILGGYKTDIKLNHSQLLKHLHPDDLPIREKAFKEALSSGYLHYQARLLWNDDSIHWMEGKGKVFYDDENKPVKLIGTIRDITEEKHQEEELKKSEEQFSTLADNMENLAWLADGEGWIYWYNKRWLEYTGLSLAEMQGWGWQKVHHPDHVENIVELSKKIWTVPESFELTFPLRRHDGEYRWFLTRGYPVTNEEGKIIRWIGTNTDIHSQKKAEEQFKVLADQAPMWVWLTDKEVNILYTNPEILKFLGIAHYTEFTGNMWEEIVHPEDIAMVYKVFSESASQQCPFSFEFRAQNAKTRQYEWFYLKGVPRLESGEFTGFIGTGININEQKSLTRELEEKVLSRTAELKASEEKFYNLFNLSPMCKTLTDAQTGKITMVNDAFTQTFEYSREETYNKTSEELGMFDPKQFEIVVNELNTNGHIKNIELEVTKKSGKKFFALASAEIINIGDKKYFLGAYNDITDRKKAEKNIEQKNIELEKMNQELQSFAYISSHDLQEPLRKIQTFATRIKTKEENNLSDYGKDMFNRMQDSAKRMQTLIHDLLAYSRTNAAEAKFENTDINKIIAEVKNDLEEELKEKQATIEANLLCHADVIPFQFRQLIHNLIGNSLKFSRPSLPPHIKISTETANGIEFNNEKLLPQTKYCHITISDNGIGFDQEYSEKIFEVFQRLHGKNEYKGTGIGLSIVKKIVENHHGIITASGEINKGAIFDIYIPSSKPIKSDSNQESKKL